MIKRLYILLIILSTFAFSVPLATSYDLADTLVYEGLGSNAITDIVEVNDSIFLFASGNGLSISYDRGENIYTYYQGSNTVSYGAITGIATLGEHMWIATAYDTMILESSYYRDYPKGNGISYTPDGGQTWERFPQSVDAQNDSIELLYGDSIPALPITSKINNLSYDLAVQVTLSGDTVLWSANFAGGCRRSRDKGETWERVILPPDRYNELNEETPRDFKLSPTAGALGYENNLNHRVFSVHIAGDTVIVGTANGINISYDEGTTWKKYTAQNSGICGNFVVDITQSRNGTIYGVALSTQEGEAQGLVVSQRNINGMLYWETYLEGIRLYNVATGKEQRVFTTGEEGLWYSVDSWNWLHMGSIQDINGQALLTEQIYCVHEDKQELLWIGTADGIARSSNLGVTWDILRRVNTAYQDPLDVSAYPNPFSPSRMNQLNDEGYVRIHCHVPGPGEIKIEVFDFSMTRVKNIVNNVYVDTEDVEFIWNGKNGLNNLVANGVYFIRFQFDDGSEQHISWTKLIVLD